MLSLAPSRELILTKFRELLREWATGAGETREDWLDLVARKMESSCYMHAYTMIRENKNSDIWCAYSMDQYSQSAGRVIANINAIMPQVLENIEFAAIVGSATVYELDPSANKAERDFINLRKLEKIPVKISRIYKCSKCKSDKTTYREYMGRGLDEGHIKAVECVMCAHTWRVG